MLKRNTLVVTSIVVNFAIFAFLAAGWLLSLLLTIHATKITHMNKSRMHTKYWIQN